MKRKVNPYIAPEIIEVSELEMIAINKVAKKAIPMLDDYADILGGLCSPRMAQLIGACHHEQKIYFKVTN